MRLRTMDKGKHPIQSISLAQQETIDDMPNWRCNDSRIGESDQTGWEENSDNDFEDVLQVMTYSFLSAIVDCINISMFLCFI